MYAEEAIPAYSGYILRGKNFAIRLFCLISRGNHSRFRTPTRPGHVCTQSESNSFRMASVSFVVEAMIRGYHVYNDIWTAVVGEELIVKESQLTLVILLPWQ